MIGLKFNKLTVLDDLGRIGHDRLYKCLCECGNEANVRMSKIKSGHTKSCGCLCGKVEIKLGDKYGMLTILRQLENKKNVHDRIVEVRCDCGNIIEVFFGNLIKETRKSCGCLTPLIISKAKKTHGESNGSEYNIWAGMKQRCYDKNISCYKNYGGRGITVCDEWINSYETFLKDMGRKPTNKHSIDRKDVNANYSKDNCKWSTTKEQANNTRTNVLIEYLGETKTIAQWAEIYKQKYYTFRRQLIRCEHDLQLVVDRWYPNFNYLKQAV
jgi:hypothetical protein